MSGRGSSAPRLSGHSSCCCAPFPGVCPLAACPRAESCDFGDFGARHDAQICGGRGGVRRRAGGTRCGEATGAGGWGAALYRMNPITQAKASPPITPMVITTGRIVGVIPGHDASAEAHGTNAAAAALVSVYDDLHSFGGHEIRTSFSKTGPARTWQGPHFCTAP